MPVGFNSPARNLFLLGSSGAQVVSNFFESISKASTTDGVFIPDEIRYIESNKKYALAGSAQDSNSKGFGWFERQDYDLVTGSLTTDYSVRIESPQAGVTTTLRAMELDSNDNLIVVGFSGTAPWIAKYSNDGVLDWQSTTFSANVRYLGITSDSSGNYYACGRTSYALPDTQAFVEKFDSNGNPGWGKQAFMLGRDVVLAKISANDRGEVVAVGFLEDDSADKGYIVKIDTNTGEVLWDRTLERNISGFGLGNPSTGSTDSITPAHVKCTACYIDSQDQIYVVGTIDGNSPNDNGVGEFLIKYTAEGNMVWQRENNTSDYVNLDGAPNMVPFDVKSDGETEQTSVLSVEDGGAFALNDSDIFISKYSKNGDLVFRRRISKGGDNLGAACLDADPSFYYIMFRDQQIDGLAGEPDRYTFGKVSTSGNGFGNFQYDDGEDIIDYTIVSNAENKIGRLSDGSVTNSVSDLMTYPFTANKLVFDDLATHVSNKKRQMDTADSFEYSGSPAIRPADFQELNLLGDVYSGSGDWLDQSGKGNNGVTSFTTSAEEPFSGAGSIEFDGTGDSISVGPLLPTSTGTAFTVDMFWRSKGNTVQKCIWEQHNSGPGRTAYFVNGTNAFLISEGNTIGSFAYSDNVWYFTRVTYTAGGTIEVFVDGVSRGTGTQTVGVDNVNFVVGDRSGANESFNGYVSNVRVIVGSALSGAGQVPTSALTNTGQTAGAPTYSDYGYGTFLRAAVNAFDGSTSTRAEPDDNKTIYFDFSHVNPTGTLLNFNGNSKLPTYLNQGGDTAGDGIRSNPIYHAFDGSTSTYCDMTYLNGQFSRLTFENPITNVTNITIGYDGEGDPGYNGGNNQTSISFNGSRQTVQLYNGSAITLTDLDFISRPGNGVCRLYDVTITVGGTATTLTLDGGVSVSSSLRTYLAKAGSPSANHFTVNTQTLGGSVPSSGWLTINGVSKLKQIALYHQSGSSSVELFAVEVDGSILVDGPGGTTGTMLLTAQGGSITDASDSNLSITVNGDAAAAVGTTNGPTHNAAGYWEFDGVDDEIDFGNQASIITSGSFTVEAWAWRDARTNENGLFDIEDTNQGVILLSAGSNYLGGDYRFLVRKGSYGAGPIQANVEGSITGHGLNEWHHYLGTYDDDTGTIIMYVDGVQVDTDTNASVKGVNFSGTLDSGIHIGPSAGRGRWHDGRVGEVRVYPRALTAAQVFQNYNATKSKYINEAPETAPKISDSAIVYDSNLILNYDFGNRATYDRAENLSEYSEDFTLNNISTGWRTDTSSYSRATLIANTGIDSPFKTNNASRWQSGDQTNQELIYHILPTALTVGETYTVSCWIRRVESFGNVQFYLGDNVTLDVTSQVDAVPFGEWVRVSATRTITGENGNPVRNYIAVRPNGNVNGGDRTTIDIWGMNVNQGSTPGRYIRTYGSAITAPTTVKNLSSSSYTGTLNGSNYVFNSNGYFETNDDFWISLSMSSLSTFTYEGWLYSTPSGNDEYGYLVTGGSFGLAISEGGTAGLGLSAGDIYYFNSSAIVSLGLNIQANQWIHVVAVFDGTANTIAVWLNGVLDAAVNVTSTQTTIDTFYRLGLNNTHEFDGNVAETRIYNRALTSTEISQNFNATRGKYGV